MSTNSALTTVFTILRVKCFRLILLCFLALPLVFLFNQGPVHAGQATLSWVAPSINEDGTPLTDLAGYKIYYGTASGNYTQNVDAGNATTYTFNSLSDGQIYYFVATAYNTARVESSYSNEISKTIPALTQTYALSVNKAGTGMVTSSPAGISCGSDCTESYNSGTSVILTASPDTSSTFTGWSGACSGTGTCSVTMNAAKSVTATFALKTYTITASAGTGGSISPSGSVSVNHGSSQSFTINANSGYNIAGVLVNGTSVGAQASYTFPNVTATQTISASFSAITYTLSVNKAGTGMVSSSPAGISCGSDCTESYNSGTSVILTASPDTSSTFTGWSGACSGTGTCSITMNAAKSVTATFALKTFTITASAGTGGSISPSSSVSVNHGSNQSFTINADSGYNIANVLVDGTSVGAQSSYTFSNVTATHTISASFTAIQQNSLNVTKAGTGTGMVTSSPAGISCGSDCSGVYTSGTLVTLTAVPDNSSSFGGWSGACTGTGTCSVTMDAARSVSPLFQANSLTITVSAGSGGSISPSGTVAVNYGGSQSFTITPNANYTVGTVVVDGSNVDSVTSYNFANVTGNHTISVSFTINDITNDAVTEIPKTGQTSIYASGDDGYFQAGTEWPASRFTNNGDGTVTDTLTGLMWLKDGGCFRKNWSTALTTIADFSGNPAKYKCAEYVGSYSDWRLPNMKEMESLINYGASNSANWLNSNGFRNVKPYYWVSTSYAASKTQAWMVYLMNGTTTYSSKYTNYYVLPVRSSTSEKSYNVPKTGQESSYAIGDDGFIQAGIEWSAPRFTDNGDGTVNDTLTGLMWLKDGGCFRKNWTSAITTVKDFNNNPEKYPCREYSSDFSDWRLPNKKEIESLVNYGASNSASWMNLNGFTNMNPSNYWSSTTYGSYGRYTSQAWVVNMKAGTSKSSGKSSIFYVLPVRSGDNVKK